MVEAHGQKIKLPLKHHNIFISPGIFMLSRLGFLCVLNFVSVLVSDVFVSPVQSSPVQSSD